MSRVGLILTLNICRCTEPSRPCRPLLRPQHAASRLSTSHAVPLRLTEACSTTDAMSRQKNRAAQQLQLPAASFVRLSVWPTSDLHLLQKKKKKGDMLSNVLDTIISQPLHSRQDSPINFSLDLLEPSMLGAPPLLASGAGDARHFPVPIQ